MFTFVNFPIPFPVLLPRIEQDFPNISFIKCLVHIRCLIESDDSVHKACLVSHATEYVLSLGCKLSSDAWTKTIGNHADEPRRSNAIGNIARAGHRPKSNDMFLS